MSGNPIIPRVGLLGALIGGAAAPVPGRTIGTVAGPAQLGMSPPVPVSAKRVSAKKKRKALTGASTRQSN
jgi:hypothetical protein